MSSPPPSTIAQLEKIRHEAQLTAQELQTAFDTIFDHCDAIRAVTINTPALQEHLGQIYQTGSVQDVLRQRLEKIARLTARIADPSLPEDDPMLAGPQSAGSGMDQDEINRLLGQSD